MSKITDDLVADVDSLLEAPFKVCPVVMAYSHDSNSIFKSKNKKKGEKRSERRSKGSRSPSKRKSGDSPYDWSPSSGNSTSDREKSPSVDRRQRKKEKGRKSRSPPEKLRKSRSR